MKKVLLIILTLTISGCASVSSTKVLKETPKIDTFVVRVVNVASHMLYFYEYDTEDSEKVLEERTLADTKKFLTELGKFLPKQVSKIVGEKPGQTRFVGIGGIDGNMGSHAILWVFTDHLELRCRDYSKRCIPDNAKFRTSLVYKNVASWESRIPVSVGANFSGSSNDKVSMKKLAEKLVEQLDSDGFIAQPFGE